ncbi:MAG: PEP-CTERM/exosortase system-associated acyltransferase [Alphaproteobacteria bacterium]|nr:PEP-CTERM/exosortase system-associated acyltransferase [Alphaproteobacteria bacterium]
MYRSNTPVLPSELKLNPEVNHDLLSKLKADVIFNVFYKIFDVVHADTPELLEQAYRLRYKVFCEEHDGYEDPSKHPSGMETDHYDSNTEHALLIYKPDNLPIGTIRIIKPNQESWSQSFPLQNLCDSPLIQNEIYVQNACEFSRFCISRDLRNYVKQDLQERSKVFSAKNAGFFLPHEKMLLKVALAMAPLGLIRGAYELALKNNILNVIGVMESINIQRLAQAGLVYNTIGPTIEYHGKRVPFQCNILEVSEHAIQNNYPVWNVVSVKGKVHQDAVNVHNRKSQNLN